MKQKALRTIATLGFLLMLTAAPAYAQTDQFRVSIPFPFNAGGKTVPSGTYRVRRVRQGSELAWVIQRQDSRGAAMFFTTAARSTVMREEAGLVFHRYGEEYFLAQVWCDRGNTGRELSETRRERMIRRELGKNPSKGEVAQNVAKVETVVLVAHQR